MEGVGTPDNLDEVQSQLVSNNGTQCGFCTPGFVMSMHSLRAENPNPTADQIEEILDGNLCRCTGYRPCQEMGNELSAFQCKPVV